MFETLRWYHNTKYENNFIRFFPFFFSKQSNVGESLSGRASQESLDGVRKRRPSFGLSSKSLTNATRIINQHLFGLPLISSKTGIVERTFCVYNNIVYVDRIILTTYHWKMYVWLITYDNLHTSIIHKIFPVKFCTNNHRNYNTVHWFSYNLNKYNNAIKLGNEKKRNILISS